ncbi:response regulator [Paenibacillus senegalensis]|uniref:response regulator n=1 Tax=Paenibacillus senegalensis TaxID=1465766 RepID=UPI0002890F43|nr:response regulator [Paenibacillus senegalensis]
MRAIIVDDEILALRYLERKLLQAGQTEIIGSFTNVYEAIEAATADKPDVIFLDISLPGMSGIEAAELLSEKMPGMDIVFVTAYEEYAIKAFELNAFDYILKPVESARLERTVTRLVHRRSMVPAAEVPKPSMLRCLSALEVGLDQPQSITWRTTKAQELFAYLLHYRGQNIRKDELLELLWPDVDRKKGTTQLYTAIYQIRKTMTQYQTPIKIQSSGTTYRLELNGMRLDAEEWEQGVLHAPPLDRHTLKQHQDLLALYRGDYLGDQDYLWAEGERERLRLLWYEHALTVADWLRDSGPISHAVTLYQQILQKFPYSEDVYWSLMKLHGKANDWTSVERVYAELCRVMEEDLGTSIQPSILDWYGRARAARG